jgi:paraquat-inducible protein B
MNPDLRAKIAAHMAAEAAKAANATTQVHFAQAPSVYATFTPPQTKNNVPASEVRNEPWQVITPGPSQVTLTRGDVIEMIRLNTEQLHIRICELENQNAAKSLEIRALKTAVGTLEIQNRQNVDKIVALERNFDMYTKATARDRADATLTAPFAASLERNVDMQARATARDRADATLAIATAPVTREEFDLEIAELKREFGSVKNQLDDVGEVMDSHGIENARTSHILQKISKVIHSSFAEKHEPAEPVKSDRTKRDDSKHRDSKHRDTSKSDFNTPCSTPGCKNKKRESHDVCPSCFNQKKN